MAATSQGIWCTTRRIKRTRTFDGHSHRAGVLRLGHGSNHGEPTPLTFCVLLGQPSSPLYFSGVAARSPVSTLFIHLCLLGYPSKYPYHFCPLPRQILSPLHAQTLLPYTAYLSVGVVIYFLVNTAVTTSHSPS